MSPRIPRVQHRQVEPTPAANGASWPDTVLVLPQRLRPSRPALPPQQPQPPRWRRVASALMVWAVVLPASAVGFALVSWALVELAVRTLTLVLGVFR